MTRSNNSRRGAYHLVPSQFKRSRRKRDRARDKTELAHEREPDPPKKNHRWDYL